MDPVNLRPYHSKQGLTRSKTCTLSQAHGFLLSRSIHPVEDIVLQHVVAVARCFKMLQTMRMRFSVGVKTSLRDLPVCPA